MGSSDTLAAMRPTAALRLQATRILRSNAHPDPKAGKYLGSWGDFGSPTQKGIITYAMSANQQNPLADTMHAAVFNVARRTAHQILYWLPPLVAACGHAMGYRKKRVPELEAGTGGIRGC